MASTDVGRTRRGGLAKRQRALHAAGMRREIVEAALLEFAARGVAETSIANIAARLGTGGSTIYHYFASKQAILEQALDRALDEIGQSVITAVGTPPTSAAEFRQHAGALSDRIAAIFAESPHTVRLFGFIALSSDSELQARWINGARRVAATFEAGLRNGVDGGLLRSELDTESITRALIGVPLGMILMSQETDSVDGGSWRRTGQALVELVCGGVISWNPH